MTEEICPLKETGECNCNYSCEDGKSDYLGCGIVRTIYDIEERKQEIADSLLRVRWEEW